jgi:hypothetical protein
VKAFEYLGYETYWFSDENFPIDFDWENTIFVTEGFSSEKIPIRETSCYLVMYEPNPKRFIDHARYIELRLCAVDFKDHVSEYHFDPDSSIKVESSVFFTRKSESLVKIENRYQQYSVPSYDVIYLNWATDLLPNEINFEDMYHPRKNNFFFGGTISKHGPNQNYSKFKPLIKSLKKKGIKFVHNDPWKTPMSSIDIRNLTKDSIVGIDLRGDQHLKENLVTCRVFKNVSYGHLAATNSKAIFNELNELGVYSEDPEELLEMSLSNRFKFHLIKEGMDFVSKNHTYLNRVNGILNAIQL